MRSNNHKAIIEKLFMQMNMNLLYRLPSAEKPKDGGK